MKRFLSVLIAGLVLSVGTTVFAEEMKVAKEGDNAPEFSLTNPISGKTVSFMKDIKGKTSALIFMNTGCSACLAEVQEVNDLKKDVGDKLTVWAIAVDKRGEAVVKAYAEQYQFDVNYLIDPTFTLPPQFGFSYTPALVIVNKDGKIVLTRGGYNPAAAKGELTKAIKAKL